MSFYTVPGMPPPSPPANRTNSYVQPSGSLQQTPPPSPEPSPQPPQARDQEPHRDLLAAWAAHHGTNWIRADALHPAVSRLIDPRERLPAVRQKLRQLAAACPELETTATGNAAKRATLYRLGETA